MQRSFKSITLLLLTIIVVYAGYFEAATSTTEVVTPVAAPLIGAKAAKADPSLTLQEMLVYAIQDEYLAKAKYELILEKFGNQTPFSNIIKAEATHIAALKPLFTKYKVTIPPDNVKGSLSVPKTLKEALQAGVQGEIDNIEMYKRFIQQDIPADVKLVFSRLRNASTNHLKAFQKGLSKM